MKLITRTYLSIAGIVFIQTLLAFNFLAISLTRYSQKDGAITLNSAREIIDNHYTQINQMIWQDLTHLSYTDVMALGRNPGTATGDLLPAMLKEIHTENLDYLTIRDSRGVFGLNLKNPYGEIPFESLPFYEGKWHPSIILKENGGALYMTGSLRIEKLHPGDRTVVVNLIKKLDNLFCKDMSYNTSSEILLTVGETAVAGTLEPEFYEEGLIRLHRSWTGTEDSEIFYDVPFYSKNYNILLHNIGELEDRQTPVNVSIMSQNLSIKERMTAIQNQFLIISIVCAALGLILSLFISRTISRPVRELSAAMELIKNGRYPRVNTAGRIPEILHLYDGFNRMAEGLRNDAVKQEKYIREITFLSDFNERIIESIQEGIAIIDRDRKISRTNTSFRKLCPDFCSAEQPEPENLSFWDVSLRENLEKIRIGRIRRFEHLSRTAGGKLFDIRLYPLPRTESEEDFSCIMMIEDETSREQMESQLLQAEKLNSLSILTAGVAHEINNPLNSIIGNVNNIRDSLTEEEDLTALNWIRQEADRIAAIIRNLMSFNGTVSDPGEPRSGKSLLDRIDKYMFYILRETPGIRYTLTDNTESLQTGMPEGQLQQILINLLNNAVQAVGNTGHIELFLYNETIEGLSYLVIHIRDDGPGIPEELRSRIYDPFFTTKPVGQGTGLGLSIVYGMVSRYHGSIILNPEYEEGSEFILRIPRE